MKQNERLAELLKDRFPWLDTDEYANGADVMDALCVLYRDAQEGRAL